MVDKQLISRREFMRVLTIAAAAYPLSSLAENRLHAATNKSSNPIKIKEPWLTLGAVQHHLFPQEKDSPGAEDIHALEYLQGMMNTPDFDKEKHMLIHNGVGWLNDFSHKQYSKNFIQLDFKSKEKILRRIESSRMGSRWLSTLLTYLIEALLTDPVYGGNPEGIGWKWLQHQPGFPRPPENKKYFKIGEMRYRNIKA